MLRIVVATPSVRKHDGQGRINYETIRRALDARHELTVLAGDIAPDLLAHPRVTFVPISGFRLPTELLRTQIGSLQISRWLALNAGAFDVVHVNGSVTMACSDINSVHFVHSAWMKSRFHSSRVRRDAIGLYYWLLTTIHSNQERAALARTKLVIAVSDQVRRELIELGIPRDRIRVLHNGVDPAEFRPAAGDRSAVGLPAGVPVALFAGDMSTSRKNLDAVLAALELCENLHLAVVGSLRRNPYPALVQRRGLSKRVTFLGFRSDLAQIMQCVDIFIFPSRYEACSVVVLEALASGLPVITTDATGGSEIVRKAGGIVLDDPEDGAALAAALKAILCDAQRATEMRRAAREVALKFSYQRMSELYLDAYLDVGTARRIAV